MVNWKKSSKKRYWDMLECLPPAAMSGFGFLVGEPADHRSANGAPRYAAFAEYPRGRFFESVEPMTITEFNILSPRDVKVMA